MGRSETICVVGLWHLGSVLAACWADLDCNVIGVDASGAVVDNLRSGRAPIFEPGLDDLLRENLGKGRLTFTTEFRQAVPAADFVFVAFDTPVDSEDRTDLVPVEVAVHAFSPHLKDRAVVVVSSQVPVGTCTRWRQDVRRLSGRRGVDLVYSPENLRLGEAIRCYLHPDRIVVGVDDDATRERVHRLFARVGAPVLYMSSASAEMAKHALNSFLATSVSFANELATLCEATKADILAVVEALKSDPRVGARAFLSPGLGFAGGTLARDVQVLRVVGAATGAGTPLLDGVLEVNRRRPELVVRRLTGLYGTLNGRVIGVLGLTYKAGTSTLRRSVALEVVRALDRAGATVRAFDPRADLSELNGSLRFESVSDAYEAARGASALVVATEWPEFAEIDFDRIKSAMANPVILDGKNLLAGLHLGERGFQYIGVGR